MHFSAIYIEIMRNVLILMARVQDADDGAVYYMPAASER